MTAISQTQPFGQVVLVAHVFIWWTWEAAYQKRLSEYHHEQKEKRAAELQKKKAEMQRSQS